MACSRCGEGTKFYVCNSDVCKECVRKSFRERRRRDADRGIYRGPWSPKELARLLAQRSHLRRRVEARKAQ